MDGCTPGLPVHHQLLESTQTHVHLVKAMVFPVVMYGCESWDCVSYEELMLLNCGVGEDS